MGTSEKSKKTVNGRASDEKELIAAKTKSAAQVNFEDDSSEEERFEAVKRTKEDDDWEQDTKRRPDGKLGKSIADSVRITTFPPT